MTDCANTDCANQDQRSRNAGSGQPLGAAPVQIDMADPHCPFRADLYAAYAGLRARGPVSRVAFAATNGEDGGGQGSPGREMLMVTHYAASVATLLDDRFSSERRAALAEEQRAQPPPASEERPPLSQSLISADPPDHTRLRKLVKPSFTGRAPAALRPWIQALADELLDDAERQAAARRAGP